MIWTLWFACLPCLAHRAVSDDSGNKKSSHHPIMWSGLVILCHYLFWPEAALEHNTVIPCYLWLWDNFAMSLFPWWQQCLSGNSLFSPINQLDLFWMRRSLVIAACRGIVLCKDPECLLCEQTCVWIWHKVNCCLLPFPLSPLTGIFKFQFDDGIRKHSCPVTDDRTTPWSFEYNSCCRLTHLCLVVWLGCCLKPTTVAW